MRLETQKHESEIEYGKMEFVWLKDNEFYKNPRKGIFQTTTWHFNLSLGIYEVSVH